MSGGEFSGIGLGGALAIFAALLAGCGTPDEESRAKDSGRVKPVSQVLTLSVETAPGVVKFDKQRLSAKAGRIALTGAASGRGRRTSGARGQSALDARVWSST